MAKVQNQCVWALIVGIGNPAQYRTLLDVQNLHERVLFLPLRPDVDFYYAAADAYVGPSLEDAFALPPLEAMACGVPAIVSRQAGVSELVTSGVDGFILEEPGNSDELACWISKLISDPRLYATLVQNSIATARKYTWDKNAEELFGLFLQSRGQ